MPKINPLLGRGPMRAGFGGIVPPKTMPALIVTTAPPTSGLKYALLPTKMNCRLIGIRAQVAWTVQPSPLEVHITLDGEDWTFAKVDPVTATAYSIRNLDMGAGIAAQSLDVVTTLQSPFILEGREMKIETETTGGTVSQMYAEVIYALY